MLFFTRIKLVARVMACACAIARIKWRGLGEVGRWEVPGFIQGW